MKTARPRLYGTARRLDATQRALAAQWYPFALSRTIRLVRRHRREGVRQLGWRAFETAVEVCTSCLMDCALKHQDDTGVPFGAYVGLRFRFVAGDFAREMRRGRHSDRGVVHSLTSPEVRERAEAGGMGRTYRNPAEDAEAFESLLSRARTERHRIVLRMVHRDGYTQDDAARRLGISTSMASVLYIEAIKDIRSQLETERNPCSS